jgi:hypothetical protein
MLISYINKYYRRSYLLNDTSISKQIVFKMLIFVIESTYFFTTTSAVNKFIYVMVIISLLLKTHYYVRLLCAYLLKSYIVL